jgi:DNA invertase Pin-like site-specific DNA recombinase
LVAEAKRKDRPFDCLLVDDTSRLARELSDALRTFKVLEFHGVSLVSVSNNIDSTQDNARTLITMHGLMDEHGLTDLSKKVHRGQEGRALKGCTTGGKRYGYKNVPIEDESRTGKYGRPAVLEVRLEINREHAAVLVRMFRMYHQGMGQGAIAIQLNLEGILGPKGRWSKYTIHEMLRNEIYHGVVVWGRTKKCRNPETGKKISRPVPESQWRRVEVPELRIIPEDLWVSVQKRLKKSRETFHKRGGLTRTERSRTYLFSGILACGDCNGSMVICAGGGRRGYTKYGCHEHKHTGTCGNGLLIRQDRLEAQLLASLERQLMNPATLDNAVARCERELKRRVAEMQRAGSVTTLESLKKQHADMQARRDRLIQAIEVSGEEIRSLTQRLREVETEIKRLGAAIATYRPVKLEVAVGSIRERVMKTLTRLHEATRAGGDVSRAKEALATYVGKLVLSPVQRDGRPVYRVQGNISVMPEAENGRMQWGAVPGHHVFQDLQTLRSEFWFQLVPIPARRQMSRAALRPTFDHTLLFAYFR